MTDCTHEWTVRFPHVEGTDGPVELVPLTVNVKEKSSKFNRAKLKFPSEVAQMLKPETRWGILRDREFVELLQNGTEVFVLVFDPDKVEYGSQYAHVTLLDPQQTLDQSTIDLQRANIHVRELYEEIYEKADSEFISEIKFTDPEEVERTLVARDSIAVNPYHDWNRQRYEAQENTKIISGSLVIDFQDVTPAEALWDLNERLGLQSWVDRHGVLWIGAPETSEALHVAAPDDSRVWRYTDVTVSHPKRPIKRLIVKGAWIESPEFSQNVKDDIVGFFKEKEHYGDERAIGIAERHDIERGTEIIKDDTGVKKDMVESVAHRQLTQATRESYKGTVRINPSLGGEFTPYHDVRVGDFINIVPEDEPFNAPFNRATGNLLDDPDHETCGNIANNEIYTITGVQHNVDDSGHWSISLDIVLYPEELNHVDIGGEVHTTLRMFKPYDEDYNGRAYDSDDSSSD